MSPGDLNTMDNRGTTGDGGAVDDGRDGKYETFPTGGDGAPSPWPWVAL